MIVCSLNEVEVYSRRAARGAGLSWGLAEEAGKASRWLAERGLPCVELLVRLLTVNDGRAYADMAPVISGNLWRAATGDLCPLCCGAALSDRMHVFERDGTIRLIGVAFPLLLVPFLDRSWRSHDACSELRWPDVRVSIYSDGLDIERAGDTSPLSERADVVELSAGGKRNTRLSHQSRVAGVSASRPVWDALNALAGRTYVPASKESRARGAGAGRTDND